MVDVAYPTETRKGLFMKLEVINASWEVQAKRIVDSIDMYANPGELVGLIGPNGSGKSSLLRLIYRLYSPHTGSIHFDDLDIWTMSTKEIARSMAVVAQERATDFEFTVNEVVLMGRTPHKSLFSSDSIEDDSIVYGALDRVGMSGFAQRSFYTLSGGEMQRVLIARALAQQAKILVLDEPTNHLDIRYQFEILELVRSLGITIIAALHDLNLAATYFDRLYLLHAGRIVTHGRPCEVLDSERIASVYGVKTEVRIHPETDQLHIVFTGLLSPISNRGE